MSAADDKKRTLVWLEYYGLARAKGQTARQAIQLVDRPPAEAAGYIEAVLGGGEAVQASIQARLGASAGLMVAAASSLPLIGGLAGALTGWARDIVLAIASEGAASCSKGCAWPKSYERRRFVGLNPPPTGHIGGFFYMSLDRCLHDGLVAHGAGSGVEVTGRLKGVYTRVPNFAADAVARSRANRSRVHAEELPAGQYDRPWQNDPATWYGRAWRVMYILNWAQHHMPCSHLMCAAAQLFAIRDIAKESIKQLPGETTNTAGAKASDAVALKGSRWYASLYWLQRDFWDYARMVGVGPTLEILRGLGATAAAAEYEALVGGKTYPPEDLEFAWSPVLSKLSWGELRGALCALKAERTRQIVAPTAARLSALPAAMQLYVAPERREEGGWGGGGAGGSVGAGGAGPWLLGGGILAGLLYLFTRKGR